MATSFWLTDLDSDISGYLLASVGDRSDACSHVRSVTNTAAGPSSGIQITRSAGGTALKWITPPLDGTDLTAAAWTLHLWAKESNLAANAALRFQVFRYTNVEAGTAALDNNAGTELTTTIADSLITTGVATVTTMNDGDRLVFKILIDDAASDMVTAHTVTVSYNGELSKAEGDTYIVCPDTIAVTAAIPAASITQVRNAFKDDATANTNLTDAQIRQAITSAVKEYSKDSPRRVASTESGDGTVYDFRLPRLWISGLSFLDEIEYPTGDQIATIVDENEWSMYESVLGIQPTRKIRFRSTPSTGTDNIIFRYTTLHTHDDEQDTIPTHDFDAVMWLATSYACLSLAGKMSQTTDSTINVDSVDYRGGQTRWEAMAKRYRELYQDHVGSASNSFGGQSGGAMGSGANRGANKIGDWDVNLQGGADRLWHGRRWR